MSRGPRLGDVVEVLWRDAETVDVGWRARSEYLDVIRPQQAYRTAGYWLGRAGGRVAVVLSVDPRNGRVASARTIPRCAVIRIRVLGRARRRIRRALKQ